MQEENLKRNFLWNTAGSLIYFAAQWLFTILVWRMTDLSTAVTNAGLLNTATAVTNVFLSLASFGMYNYQVSDVHNRHAQSAYVRSRAATCLGAAALCIAFLFVSNLVVSSNPYTKRQIICILLMLMFRLIESTTDVYNAIYQKHGRLDIVGKTYAARGALSLLSFVLLLRFTGSLTLTLAVMVLCNLVFFLLYTLRRVSPFYTKTSVPMRAVGLLLWECAPLALYSFLNTTTTSIPKIMLERMYGSEMLGIYGSVTAPVLLLQVGATYLFTPFITMFTERYAARDEKGFYKAIRSVFGIIILLLPLGLAVARFLGGWGLRTFVDSALEEYSPLLAPMVVSAVLTALVLFFSMVLTVMRCMKGLILANVGGIVTSVLVSAPLLEKFEMQGATYAMILALTIQTLCLATFIAWQSRVHFCTGLDAAPQTGQSSHETEGK